MNRLKGRHCYLAGAMDRVEDGGVIWREMIKEKLNDLEIKWFDPTCKPKSLGVEDEHTRQRILDAKKAQDFDLVVSIVKSIRHVDLRMIDHSAFLIVFLDKDNSGFGTIEEISSANRGKKPILICQEGGKEFAPNWLFGMIPHNFIFGSWEELTYYVRHVAGDEIVDKMNRWVFL